VVKLLRTDERSAATSQLSLVTFLTPLAAKKNVDVF